MKIDLNVERLKKVCYAKTEKFGELSGFETVKTPNGLNYYFQDNGSKILAVGHLDTVQQERSFVDKVDRIYCPQLDDRLGVYIILDLLPKMGIEVDVLLTDGEETGMSTARYFDTEKQYNWIVEFDRAGEDVVLYKYEDDTFESLLESVDFQIGTGIYSDIAELEDLGAKAMNVGIGYKRYHSKDAFFEVAVMKRQVERFARFYQCFQDLELKHTADYNYGSGYGHGYQDTKKNDWYGKYEPVTSVGEKVGETKVSPMIEPDTEVQKNEKRYQKISDPFYVSDEFSWEEYQDYMNWRDEYPSAAQFEDELNTMLERKIR